MLLKNKTRLTLYKTIIRTQLEYASSIWSPHTVKGKIDLERIQRQSAGWISSLKRKESVTQALDHLNLNRFEKRRMQKDAKIPEDIPTNKIDKDLTLPNTSNRPPTEH